MFQPPAFLKPKSIKDRICGTMPALTFKNHSGRLNQNLKISLKECTSTKKMDSHDNENESSTNDDHNSETDIKMEEVKPLPIVQVKRKRPPAKRKEPPVATSSTEPTTTTDPTAMAAPPKPKGKSRAKKPATAPTVASIFTQGQLFFHLVSYVMENDDTLRTSPDAWKNKMPLDIAGMKKFVTDSKEAWNFIRDIGVIFANLDEFAKYTPRKDAILNVPMTPANPFTRI